MLLIWSRERHSTSEKSRVIPFISSCRHGCRITCRVEASLSGGRAKPRPIGLSQHFISFAGGETETLNRYSPPERLCLRRRTQPSYSFEFGPGSRFGRNR